MAIVGACYVIVEVLYDVMKLVWGQLLWSGSPVALGGEETIHTALEGEETHHY